MTELDSSTERLQVLAASFLSTLPSIAEASGGNDQRAGSTEDVVEILRMLAGDEHVACADAHDEVEDVLACARRLIRVLRQRDVPPSAIAKSLDLLRTAMIEAPESSGAPAPWRTGDPTPGFDRRFALLAGSVAQAIAEDEARARRELEGVLEIFTRTLAHELKNPLGAAEGAAHMLLDVEISADPAQRKRFAEMIARNLRRATDLVSDLRVVVSTRLGAEGKTRPHGLRSIAEEVVHEVEPFAVERGVRLSVLEPLPDPRVDGARTTLVLMNLVWNAVKYSDPSKAERWVRIGGGRSAEGDWHLFVADNGVGIAAADQERVFERFERARPDLASGTGLGLAIAREAARQLGGRLWFESEQGLGTTFHMTLPEER